MAVRYSEVQIHMGEVIVSRKSDPLEVGFSEALTAIRENVRKSYWDVQDTPDGVVHITRQGLVTVWTVQVITEPICGRHGGPWGDDPTCEDCTYENGNPKPVPEA